VRQRLASALWSLWTKPRTWTSPRWKPFGCFRTLRHDLETHTDRPCRPTPVGRQIGASYPDAATPTRLILSRLNPFGPAETDAYINHRLSVAGYEGTQLFTPEARAVIAAWSKGIPRNINNLCFNALSLGYA